MKRKLFVSTFLILLFSITLVPLVRAQEGNQGLVTDDDVNKIAKQLYCPVCENIPLDVCGTQACAQWRDLIREKLTQGWNEDEIKEYFVLQYGDRVLSEPPRQGLNWLVYIIPPVVFLAGVYVLFRGIQNWRQAADPDMAHNDVVDQPLDDYVARMEEELQRTEK